ncbi:putative serine/threonine protein kinase [Streptomyces sp. L-9-10]|uniref:serine/threonine-protein kinase n=1 Tax=unclassified Streptomyces TaxID=2593676 RepID=UPI00101B723D|nr:serine/threonine-protein kinase [Streptomyces sp. L-9-10]RYJ20039.1 putative serine/threonine protein kinase [Streptomyces sp. L-9-10]
MQPLEAGDPAIIGQYRLLGRLGSGGMGRVYVARSHGGRTVAVKVVHPHFATDEEFRARFRREVDAAQRVGTAPDGSRWSAPVLDADPEAAVPWVATAYVAGPSLTQAVGTYGPLPAHSVRALGAGLAEALEAVHGLGLVHRDVKPSNVLLAPDGPRLIDFGIARATDGTASLTSTGVSVGSPGYMSPEQILGTVVAGASDVFSLGAVLAYAVTGTSPFPGDSSAALLYKVVHEEPELGSLRGELRELVADCLAKDPSVRPAPAEIVRRLAGGGAAAGAVRGADGAQGLVAAGWLPAPLVEEVSLAVVRLLHLEAAAPPVQTGPVPFSNPSLGAFGPPTDVEAGPPTAPPSTPPGDSRQDAPAPGARFSVSVSADTSTATGTGPDSSTSTGPDSGSGPDSSTGTGTGRRARKVSCTVALAVAGAMAAVMVGSAFLFDLIPGGGTNDSASMDKTGTSPSASASAAPAGSAAPTDSGPPTDSGDASVPAELVGVWDGEVTAAGLPAGTMKVTIQTGSTGERVGKAEQTDILGNFICEDLLTLTGVEGNTLVVDARRGPRSKDMCTESTTGLRLGLERDGLRYLSEDARAGSPTGVLTKQR